MPPTLLETDSWRWTSSRTTCCGTWRRPPRTPTKTCSVGAFFFGFWGWNRILNIRHEGNQSCPFPCPYLFTFVCALPQFYLSLSLSFLFSSSLPLSISFDPFHNVYNYIYIYISLSLSFSLYLHFFAPLKNSKERVWSIFRRGTRDREDQRGYQGVGSWGHVAFKLQRHSLSWCMLHVICHMGTPHFPRFSKQLSRPIL